MTIFTRKKTLYFLGLLTITMILGLFAQFLNQTYYANYGPFYDSLSYYQKLARVIHTGQTEGVISALKYSTTLSTVFLPYGMAAIVSQVVTLDRALSVWLQLPFVFLMLHSSSIYLSLKYSLSRHMSVVLAVPLVTLAGIFNSNGGLGDFRMDLLLYLTLGTASLWLLIALERLRLKDWIICGVFGSLACLSRSTALVYLMVLWAPILVLYISKTPGQSLKIIRGGVCLWLVFLLLTLWFYVLNFDRLYYYYFIWNSDANAELPLGKSLSHFKFAYRSVGGPILVSLVSIFVFMRFREFKSTGRTKAPVSRGIFSVPWEIIWLAIAPAGFLALTGAGLNPFVAMPSAFGMILLLLVAVAEMISRVGGVTPKLIIAVSLTGCVWSAFEGYKGYQELRPVGVVYFSEPFNDIVRVSRDLNQKSSDDPSVSIDIVGCGAVMSVALENFLIYEHEFIMEKNSIRDGVTQISYRVGVTPRMNAATEIEWNEIAGADNGERIESLVSSIQENADLVLIPTKETAIFLAEQRSYNFVNRFVPDITNKLFEDPGFEVIIADLRFSEEESYSLLRKVH